MVQACFGGFVLTRPGPFALPVRSELSALGRIKYPLNGNLFAIKSPFNFARNP
jgi:hypothetical protein